MKKIYSIFLLLVIALAGLSLAGCSEDNLDTNQFGDGVRLNAFGPSPVMRGGQLRFIGSNLDQIREVHIPGVSPITNIEVIKAGVPSEIRVTVPKDGPEEGFVTIVANDDRELTTITKLTYTEPIIIESITPLAVMPGEELSIKGDYLNLIHMIEFAEGVRVSENDFTSHDRYEIKLVVPEEARTGKLNLYTADLLVEDNPNDVSYNIITSDDAVEVGTPTVSKVVSPRGEAAQLGSVVIKQGETLTISGSYMKLVKAVKFGSVEVTDITVSGDGKSVSLVLPAEAPDGDVNIVCQSGIEVPVCTIETVAPTNCVAAPAPVKAGAELTITGNDMDVVDKVEMPNVSADIEIALVDGKVVIKAVPETATEGSLVLRMKNGKGVEVPFTLVKPTVTGYDNASVSAGGALVIKGTELDLVKSVKFGESDEVTEFTAQTSEAITLTVPMNAQSGAPTLTLANGTTVENVPELNVSEAVFCYVTEWPSADAEIKAGETITLSVANGDKLTGVEIKGQSCQFVLSGQNKEQLIVGVPQNAGKGSDVRLISSNGEISYKFDFIPATEVSNVVWKGMTEITWSDGGRVIVPASAFDGAPAGAVLTVSYTQKVDTWAQAQFNYGDWSGINFGQAGEGMTVFNQTLVPTDVYGWAFDSRETSMILTQEILDNIQAKKGECEGKADCGIIIQGSDLIFTKITLSYQQSLETTIWAGSEDLAAWGNNFGVGSDAGAELAAAGATVGSVVRFYGTAVDAEWQVKIEEGHWSGTYASFAGYAHEEFQAWDLASNGGCVSIKLTQAMLDAAYTQQWWGNTFIVHGQNFILTKVTVE